MRGRDSSHSQKWKLFFYPFWLQGHDGGSLVLSRQLSNFAQINFVEDFGGEGGEGPRMPLVV